VMGRAVIVSSESDFDEICRGFEVRSLASV
jgi:hypothetical protein